MAHTNGFTVWFTGMHGTGKSTLANYVAARLRQVGRNVEVLDENDVVEELAAGLGDTKDERNVVVRRLGYVAGLLARNNVATIVAAVSPYKSSREDNRRLSQRYIEVYVDCPTEKLIERDSSGKYKKALAGEIPNFIGITEPYEPPSSPEVTIHSDVEAVDQAGLKIFQSLLDLGYVSPEDVKIITGTKLKPNKLAKKARREGKATEKGARSARSVARPAARVAKAPPPNKVPAKKAVAKRKAR